MIRLRLTLLLVITVAFSAHRGYAQSFYDSELNFQYYWGGNHSIYFQTLKYENTYYIRLTGATTYNVLWFRLNGGERDPKLLVEDGTFDVYYIFKDGAGLYRINVYGTDSVTSKQYTGLCQFDVLATEDAPDEYEEFELNHLMIDFIDQNMGDTIGTGECWDVAQYFLDSYSADWVRTTNFGKLLDPALDEIKPGDIIQFQSVRLKSETVTQVGDMTYYSWSTQTLGTPDHTAVVYEVIDNLHYQLAHQNIGGRRYIQVTEVDLNNLVSGTYRVYRPIAGLIPVEWLE